MNKQKAICDLKASLSILECNIGLFHQGNRELYRVIATELRKLLCDGKQALLEKLFPGIQLLPLRFSEQNIGFRKFLKEKGLSSRRIIVQIPATSRSGGSDLPRIESLFYGGRFMDISEWLEQPFLNDRITISEFIKSIADKESVHSDPDYNATLKLAKSVYLGNEESHKQLIVAIGEYIMDVIKQLDEDKLIDNSHE